MSSAGRIAVAGSIATDHLMHFPGRFSEALLPDQLHRVSLSFLVDDLVVRRGGVACNISFGLAQLGQRPILVGAAGQDFDEYQSWLTRHGVDCEHVYRVPDVQTARFVCTTDDDMNQIASFYAGAMSRAGDIELAPIAEASGGFSLVLVGADEPAAMIRHSRECRERGYPFAADPSQQLARLDGDQVVDLVRGAELLFTNDYELGLLQSKTGWTVDEIQAVVGHRITTLGSEGIEIVGPTEPGGPVERLHVAALPEEAKVDPTGVGDAFRAGFLAGRSLALSMQRSAQLGALLATLTLETVGPQDYVLHPASARQRLSAAYGDAAGAEIAAAFGWSDEEIVPPVDQVAPVGSRS